MGRERGGEGDEESQGQRQGPAGLPDQPHREAGAPRFDRPSAPSSASSPSPNPSSRGSCISTSPRHRGAARSSSGSSKASARRGDWQLGPLDLEIFWGERVGILGPNGAGKTTLLGMLVGTVPIAQGRRWVGPGVVFGELSQARRRFRAEASLVSGFLGATGLHTGEGRALLAKLGLGASEVERPFASLSPGERTRAELALLMATGTNCLLLDEPTNHLDLSAIEQLELALAGWTGTLLLVTHDRRLLEAVSLTRSVELQLGAETTRGSRRGSTLPA